MVRGASRESVPSALSRSTSPPITRRPTQLLQSKTTKVFRAVRHITQTKKKFGFQLFIEEVRIRLPKDAEIVVDWIRGNHHVRTSTTRVVKYQESTCSWLPKSTASGDDEPLRINAALFTINEDNGFNEKLSQLKVLEVERNSKSLTEKDLSKAKVKQLGVASLDLSKFTDERFKQPSFKRINLTLSKCTDPSAHIKCLVSWTEICDESKEGDDIPSISMKSDEKCVPSMKRNQESRHSSNETAKFGSSHTNSENVKSVKNSVLKKENIRTDNSKVKTNETATDTSIFDSLLSSATVCTSPETPKSSEPMNLRKDLRNQTSPMSQSMSEKSNSQGSSRGINTPVDPGQLSNCVFCAKYQLVLEERDETLKQEKRTIVYLEQTLQKSSKEYDERIKELMKQLEGMHEALERSQKQIAILNNEFSENKSNAKRATQTRAMWESEMTQGDSSADSTPKQKPMLTKQLSLGSTNCISQNKSPVSGNNEVAFSPSRVLQENVVLRQNLLSITKKLEDKEQIIANTANREHRIIDEAERNILSLQSQQKKEMMEMQQKVLSLHKATLIMQNEKQKLSKEKKVIKNEMQSLRACNRDSESKLTNQIESLKKDKYELSTNYETELKSANDKLKQRIKYLETTRRGSSEKRSDPREENRPMKGVVDIPQINRSQSESAANIKKLKEVLNERETELIDAKLKLAESETNREAEICRLKRRFTILKQHSSSQTVINSDLENQLTDLRRKSRRAKGFFRFRKRIHFS